VLSSKRLQGCVEIQHAAHGRHTTQLRDARGDSRR
jgi:hypothetical protein